MTELSTQAADPLGLLGVVSILFVIYVWQAPLGRFSDFLTD